MGDKTKENPKTREKPNFGGGNSRDDAVRVRYLYNELCRKALGHLRLHAAERTA
jgi:hypothetical protein